MSSPADEGGHILPSWLAPLLLPQELAASDHFAIHDRGIAGIDLMERAGAALADAALRVLPRGPIVVLCGPGNNGGDGFVAARILQERGRAVRVVLLREPSAARGDAALALQRLAAAELLDVDALEAALLGAGGVIDAMLGTGARGAPTGPAAQAIDAVVASGLPVVACDLPSGIDAASGEVPGSAVHAVATVTFHRPSPGHLIHPAKSYVGQLIVADIGLPPGAPITPQHGALRDAVLGALPSRGAQSHKYAAGAVLVVAGSAEYPGAAVLAVRGAQRAGAGYVTALVPEAAAAMVHARSPEAIVRVWPAQGDSAALRDLLEARADAIVVGPGMSGEHAQQLVPFVLADGRPAVLDADGLAPYAGRPEALHRDAPLILTPHAGELARLLGCSVAEVGAQRLRQVCEAARRSGAVVVLKGDDTIIADPGGLVAINELPAPALATAGTGDVLAGAIGALLAGGAQPLHAAAGAVWLHARAGRRAADALGGCEGVVAWDVADQLPAARGR